MLALDKRGQEPTQQEQRAADGQPPPCAHKPSHAARTPQPAAQGRTVAQEARAPLPHAGGHGHWTGAMRAARSGRRRRAGMARGLQGLSTDLLAHGFLVQAAAHAASVAATRAGPKVCMNASERPTAVQQLSVHTIIFGSSPPSSG
mgnify:CR=1 FL=1